MKSLRQRKLVELLTEEEIMSRSELALALDVAQVTIRRDLEELEQEGLISKVHGGAKLARSWSVEPSFADRSQKNAEEKKRIGAAAARLIVEGSIAMFDAGTTTLAAIRAVPPDRHFTAVTTALQVAVALCQKPRAEIVLVGGHVHHQSQSAADQDALERIHQLRADIVLLSTRGFSVDAGTFEPNVSLVRVKRAMAESSRRVVVLMDQTKFGVESLQLTIPLDRIDLVITDSDTPKHYIRALEKAGIETQVV